jgi:hypothetical protein
MSVDFPSSTEPTAAKRRRSMTGSWDDSVTAAAPSEAAAIG